MLWINVLSRNDVDFIPPLLLRPYSNETAQFTVMLLILVTSLVAVSFPAISEAGVLRLPDLLLFIGKHFGTGVILATAFIHLLPDSFSALMSRAVKERYGNVGKWTGLIILSSLLAIFLIEYISTTYVDRLHAKPSASPTPAGTLTPTEPAAHDVLPFLANSPKIMRLRSASCRCHGACVCARPTVTVPDPDLEEHHHHRVHHHHQSFEDKRRIGRRRQIVGIFVLQVGIMIHSLVIGLTLSVTSGADFTSLTTAILFHQLFEGLSLGIRISALPPAKAPHDHHDDDLLLPPPDATTPLLAKSPARSSSHFFDPLKSVLSLLFAVTTPIGMLIGMAALKKHGGSADEAALKLTSGVMSAVSAGMLIYAATVEMIAGDFVFGDVEGGHHHHGHGHHHQAETVEPPDSHHDDDDDGHEHRHGDNGGGHEHKQASVAKKALAVMSLLAGVAAMVLIGLKE